MGPATVIVGPVSVNYFRHLTDVTPEDVPLVEFMCLIFTRRRLRSLLNLC